MRFSSFMIFLFALFTGAFCYSEDIFSGHNQLLVVTSSDWMAKQGSLQLYERKNDESEWIAINDSMPVVLGKKGLAWGIGLHPVADTNEPFKKEGDEKSPAGIFSLGKAFGFFKTKSNPLKVDYLPLNSHIEAIDDPSSSYYNCIVNSSEITSDWQSSEKMGEEPLYALGMVVNHNFPNPQPGKGSAIFLHIWRTENSGTAGCTAMSLENLNNVLFWLDKNKSPLLVQLPILKYNELKPFWNLPSLNNNALLNANNLVDLSKVIPGIVLDIRYATENNFLGFPVYAKPVCYLHKKAAVALLEVQKELSTMGLGLKVFDGYRPLSVQQVMWDTVQDERYVSNPAINKGRHTRGTAIDLTIVYKEGNELEMPTPFDDFTEKAHSDYPHLSETILKNRTLLAEVMERHGFQRLPTEWWHFDFDGWRDDSQFPPLDIAL